jgi:hypothetical protein
MKAKRWSRLRTEQPAMTDPELESLRERLQAIRELHREMTHMAGGDLVPWCNACGFGWPCPTVRLVDPPNGAARNE